MGPAGPTGCKVQLPENGLFTFFHVLILRVGRASLDPSWPLLPSFRRRQTRMACKYIWGEVKELNGEQKTATYKPISQRANSLSWIFLTITT